MILTLLMSALSIGIAGDAGAATLHDNLITVDTKVDVPRIEDAGDTDYLTSPDAQVDIVKMETGGLDVVFFVLSSTQGELTPESYKEARDEALARYATIRRMLDRHPDRIALANTVDEALAIHRSGKLVAFLGMENGYPLAQDAANLREFHALGVRYLGLTGSGHNGLGDSASPNRENQEPATVHGGLSAAGRAVVAEANRLGIMIDITHAHRGTTIEIASMTAAPIIASHSAVRGVHDSAGNLDDDQLRAVQETGGVVQVVAFGPELIQASEERMSAIMKLAGEVGLRDGNFDPHSLAAEMREKFFAGRADIDRRWPRVTATVADMVDHIDYVVALIGVNHVGISSDFGGGGGIDGWHDASETRNVTNELIARGYSDADIRKIWGGNLFRALSEVERVARTENP